MRAHLGTRWQELDHGRRIALVALVTLAIALGAGVFWWAGQPRFVVAYTDLNPQEAGRITSRLRDRGVPYRLTSGGTAVMVPLRDLDQVWVELAMEGLPQDGNVGFEVFDRSALGLSDFAEKVNFRRALEGELSRTISRLEAVESARVHLVLPEPRLFTEDQREPSASVLVALRPGATLDTRQVRGLVHLVSSAVEGLHPDNVTVMDRSGRLLTSPDTALLGGAASLAQVELVRAYEQRIEGQVDRLLAAVLGPGRAAVSVTAELDFDRLETRVERATPSGEGGTVVSSREVTETFQGEQSTPGGVPGVESNIPGISDGATFTGPVQYQRTETLANVEPGRTVEHLVRTPGAVKRLSVAVAVDMPEATPAQLQELTRLVSTAAGVDTRRGDRVELRAMPFDRSLLEQETERLQELLAQEQQQRYLRYGIHPGGAVPGVARPPLGARPRRARGGAGGGALPARTPGRHPAHFGAAAARGALHPKPARGPSGPGAPRPPRLGGPQ